jgi:hypothetical protein
MARVAYTGGNAWILSEVWGSELGMREWLESTILPAVWATVHGRSDEEPTGRAAGTSDTRARPTDRPTATSGNCSVARQSASRIQTNAAKRKKMMPPMIKNPAHEKAVPIRKLTITPTTSSSRPNPTHNQVASRRREVGLGVDPAPLEAVTGNHPAPAGHGLVSSSLFLPTTQWLLAHPIRFE